MRSSIFVFALSAFVALPVAAQPQRLAKNFEDGDDHGLVCRPRVQCIPDEGCATGVCESSECVFDETVGPEIACCEPLDECTIGTISTTGGPRAGTCRPLRSDNGMELGICLPTGEPTSAVEARLLASLYCAFGVPPGSDAALDAAALDYECFGFESAPDGEVAALLIALGDCDGDHLLNAVDDEPCVAASGDDDDSAGDDDDDDDSAGDDDDDSAGDDDDDSAGDDDDDDDSSGDDDDDDAVIVDAGRDSGHLADPSGQPVDEVVGEIRGGGICATSHGRGTPRALPLVALGLVIATRLVRRRRR